VAIIAAFSVGVALFVGNVLGSNIFNISVIMGLAAVLLGVKAVFSRNINSGNNIIPPLANLT
jgi:Ca2+/Na+ antiporter